MALINSKITNSSLKISPFRLGNINDIINTTHKRITKSRSEKLLGNVGNLSTIIKSMITNILDVSKEISLDKVIYNYNSP